MDIIIKAITFAEIKHRGQKDDSGVDYIIHPNQTADIIYVIAPGDKNLIAAAYLHDTIEDTDTSYEELVTEFNTDIANLVNEVTHEGKKDHKGYYFPRLKTKRGIMLKFADRLSNLSRMEVWEEDRRQAYLDKSKFWKSE